jgi:hypothetical protein
MITRGFDLELDAIMNSNFCKNFSGKNNRKNKLLKIVKCSRLKNTVSVNSYGLSVLLSGFYYQHMELLQEIQLLGELSIQ